MAGRPLQSLRLRQAIVAALRADDDLTRSALRRSPAASTESANRRPSPGRSSASASPTKARCARERAFRVTVHTFSKAQFDDEDRGVECRRSDGLEDAVLELSAARKAYMRWISSQVIADAAEANAWHGLNSFDATIG
jgi:hypothetical protein